VICSNSLSCLLAVESCETRSPFILKMVEIFWGLVAIGERVIFAWIPSHVGVPGRPGTHWMNLCSVVPVPCTYFEPFMVKCILGCWQDSWDQQIHNGLHKVHSLVGRTPLFLQSGLEGAGGLDQMLCWT